jgi:hypothetical protein
MIVKYLTEHKNLKQTYREDWRIYLLLILNVFAATKQKKCYSYIFDIVRKGLLSPEMSHLVNFKKEAGFITFL